MGELDASQKDISLTCFHVTLSRRPQPLYLSTIEAHSLRINTGESRNQ